MKNTAETAMNTTPATKTDATKTAEKLLAAARTTDPGLSAGAVRHKRAHGDLVISHDHVTGTYELGTEARVVKKGRRGAVLPLLEKVLAAPGDQSVTEILADIAA